MQSEQLSFLENLMRPKPAQESMQAPASKLTVIVIWGAMCAAIPMYFIVSKIINYQGTASKDMNSILYVLTAAATLELIVGFIVSKTALTEKMLRLCDGKTQMIQHVLLYVIISSAIFEAIGVHGLVLYLLGFGQTVLLAFLTPSFVAVFSNYFLFSPLWKIIDETKED